MAFIPGDVEVNDLFEISDKLNHIVAFFTLNIVANKAKIPNHIVLLVLFVIFIEVVQFFIPSRDFSLLDILADSVGILLSFVFLNKEHL